MKKQYNLTILSTSDTHGFLLPINYSNNSKATHGLSLLLTKIKEYSKENRLLIDVGDSIQGSPLLYFHHLNQAKYPNPVSEIFNYADYDYYIPGNHDFNYGKEYLKDFASRIHAKTLCQNIYNGNDLLFDYGFDIKEFPNGIRVLIVGVTTKYIPNWENPINIENYVFKDPVVEANQIIKKYKDDVDLVVLAYHGGFEKNLENGKEYVKDTGENQGYEMFKELQDVDILLTGHQHRLISKKINNRLAIQPGCFGSHLAVIEVDFDHEKKVSSITSSMVEAKGLEDDLHCKEILQDVEAANQSFLDEVIGIVMEVDLRIKDSFLARRTKHPIVDFINKIQLESSGAMLSATSLANQVTGFNEKITVRDVLSTYIYSNTLVVVEIDGVNLKAYLEKCAEYFVLVDGEVHFNPRFSYPKLEHYNYDMLDGIDYTIDLRHKFGERITSIQYNNKEVSDSDKFTLVLNNYRAAGGGDFDMLRNLPVLKEIPLEVAELMIDYIRLHKYLKIDTKDNITIRY